MSANMSKEKFGLDTAVVTGSEDGRTTIKLKRTNLNNVLTLFSPISKAGMFLCQEAHRR